MFPGAVCAEILSLPDSLITDDNVYKYTFSDFDKAQQVMEQLRKRKSLSMFRMDVVEGDLYFNVGQYYKALKFYKRALDSDSVRNNDKNYMEQVHRMISCYDCLHNENKKSLYVYLLLKGQSSAGIKPCSPLLCSIWVKCCIIRVIRRRDMNIWNRRLK